MVGGEGLTLFICSAGRFLRPPGFLRSIVGDRSLASNRPGKPYSTPAEAPFSTREKNSASVLRSAHYPSAMNPR